MNSLETQSENKTVQLFRRGLGLKKEVASQLQADYASAVVEHLRANDYKIVFGELTIFLAREFGFCYGVDRAVDYAYQSRKKFPDRRVFLTGEIIHNPYVNNKMRRMGIEFLTGQYAGETTYTDVRPEDVIILPAFGVSRDALKLLSAKGCILVDTTCGSVLNVWKRVEQYAREGFTSIIHGKFNHEETIATASQTKKYPDAHYLVVLNMDETERVCDYIAGRGSKREFMRYFANSASPNFDPDVHLSKIGVANQTTMLSNESLAISKRLEAALADKVGTENLPRHYRAFDTICSATQERQDAILELVENEPLDLMLVLGGYNSSNTTHLAEIASEYTRAFHIDDARCLQSASELSHQPVGSKAQTVAAGWLPEGKAAIGLTAGASTPNNKIGEVILRLAELQGIVLDDSL